MSDDLEKLNRLRVNAGKSELKAWKASKGKLTEAIKELEGKGFTDALPGANVQAKPVTDDPEIAKNLKDEEKEDKKPDPPVKKAKPQLGKGLENEPMARQSRIAVQQQRERERVEEKAQRKEAKAKEKEDKKSSKKIAGEVDAKKEPEKSARQKKHIADKQKARAENPKPEKNPNEITVADVARKLDIDPKVARAKLRRHKDVVSKLYAKGVTEGWTFPKTAEAPLTKLLKGS